MSRTPGALAEQRFMALEVLERLDGDVHERAEQAVLRAVASRRPFGLYLRNFDLGGRVMPGRDVPHGMPQVVTLVSTQDRDMHMLVAERGGQRVAFVAIENRASDIGELMRSRTPPPADFPHQVRLSDDARALAAVTAAVDELIARAQPAPTAELPRLPAPDRPPAHALSEAHANAVAAYDAAMRHLEEGDGVAAEDALMRSIAFSHWAHDPLGRAMALMMLGHVEHEVLGYPNEAVAAYLLALDRFDRLFDTSEAARELHQPLVEKVAAYLDELGDAARATQVRARTRR